jgi:Tol biopolymer transport system component
MKKFVLIMIAICFSTVGCVKSPENQIETVSMPVETQKFIGRFQEDVSIYRESEDKLVIQKELEESFELFSVDMDKGILRFEYTISPQDKLLYFKQLNAERVLKVKQLGNSEENNVLLLEGKAAKKIAEKIAFSQTALVSTSPSQKYVVYCAVDDILNRYGLYLYHLETGKTLQLIDTVNEELLNDMEWNLSWSPDEDFLAVSDKAVFYTEDGKLLSEINAENSLWSPRSSKLAYIKSVEGYGRSIFIFDTNTAAFEEVFIVNKGEYLPGYMVWNENETKLAFVTAMMDTDGMQGDISPYKAIYSSDLTTKEAIRIDTALDLNEEQIARLESLHYNSTGNILAFTLAHDSTSDLYVYNLITGAWEFFINAEYLHCENNENYVCSAGNSLYFVQRKSVIAIDESLRDTLIYQSPDVIEDMYISSSGSTMIIVEKSEKGMILRQLANFAAKSM